MKNRILFITLFISFVLTSCSHSSKKSEGHSGYGIGDIRPFLRLKTVYYYKQGLEMVDISDLPFVPLEIGREFGYVIPVKQGAPHWKIKEVMTTVCEKGFKVHPKHQAQRILEWEKPETGLKIQSHNQFDETDCPGKYLIQIYIDGFLADEIQIFVTSQESSSSRE